MHTKKVKRSKKKGVKSKIKRMRTALALGQATATGTNDPNLDKDEVLDFTPLDKRLKGLSKNRSNKERLVFMSEEKAHVCKVCGAGFKSGLTLKYHLDHYGDPTYPCEECGTKFTDEKQLNFHIGQTHVLKPLKKFKFQCPVCGQLIMTSYFLKSHMCHYHEGWENLHPNLFDSEAACLVAVNNENDSSSTVTLEKDNYSALPPENHDCTRIPLETKSSSMIPSNNISTTIPSETDISEKLHPEQKITSTIHMGDDISEKTSSEQNGPSTIPSQNDMSEKMPPEQNITSTILLESDISEKILPEQNILSTIPSERDIIAFEEPGVNVNEAKTPDREITKTMASEIATTENDAVDTIIETTVVESVVTETSVQKNAATVTTAPGSVLTETISAASGTTEGTASAGNITETTAKESDITETTSSQSTTTEATAPASKITKMKAAENNIRETKTLEDSTAQTKSLVSNMTETMSPEGNTSNTQVSETKANTPPLNFQNHLDDENKKGDESSMLIIEMGSPNDQDASSQKIAMECNVPVTDSSSPSFVSMNVELNEVETLPSVTTKTILEEKEQNENSPDASQYTEEADKSDTTSFIDNIAANVVVPLAGNSNRDDASLKRPNIDRETELKALHSCKDCYVSLPRLNINRKKKRRYRRRDPPKTTDCLSSSTLFPRKSVVHGASSTDASAPQPKYRKIESGPSTPFPCDLCNESFNTHASRMLHVDLRHTVIPSIVCDKTFSTRHAILRHYRQRHFVYTGHKIFCVCGMELVGQTAIHRHFDQYATAVSVTKDLPPPSYNACHPLPTKFDCVKCGAKFWLKSCFEYHQTLDCVRTEAGVQGNTTSETTVHKRYKRPCKPFRLHSCSVCETTFWSPQQLVRHEERYSRREKHQCKICGTVFNGPQVLSGHMRTTHLRRPNKRYPYYCRICDQGFNIASAERIHRMHFHRDGVSFANEDTSESDHDHSRTIHQRDPGKRYPYYCRIGDQDFTVAPAERIHGTQFHPDGFSFVKGDTSDSDRDDLPMTDSDVSEDEATKECNVCGHEFTSGQRYVNHLIYYTRSEIIECGICLEEFAGQYQAHRHNKLVHYTTESRDAFTHFCTICREGFMWKTHLHSHLCHVHGIPAIEAQCMINLSDSKKNNNQKVGFLNVADTCKICDITFPSPVLLAAHEIENLNDGEFVCNKCSRRCRTASILLDHLSLNHSSTIVQDGVKCRRCNEKFQTRSAWVSHVKHFHFSKEPSEFYFEKNIASSEKLTRNLRYELNVPTNSSISSGLASFRIKSWFGDSTYTPETIVPDGGIAGNADNRNFIKVEAANSTNECRINGQTFGLGPEIPWTCAVCLVSFPGPAELARHTALFSDEGHYMCEFCGRRFAWLSIYEEHKKKHYRNDVDKFFCPTCNEGFETLQSQTSHEAHFHNRSPGVTRPEDRNCDNALQSKSPNNPRSLPHPKLPSIVSFFQSESTNEQQSSSSLPGLPEQRKLEEERNEPSLHTEIFEDELSMSYQCPDCQEIYRTLEEMHEHLIIAHNMKHDPIEITVESVEDIVEDSPEDYPDDSPEDFPVNLAANLPEDLPEDSSTFVDSVKCGICDMQFVSENLLSVHRNTMHSSNSAVVRKNLNTLNTVQNSQSSKVFITDHTYDTGRIRKLRPNGTVRKRYYQIRDRSAELAKPDKRRVKRDLDKLQSAGQVTVVRCEICDIVFMNKKILQAHEVNVHGRVVDDNQSSDDSGKVNDSSTGAIEQLSLLVGKLPIAPKDVDATAVNIDFESVMLPVTTSDFDTKSPETEKSPESPKPIENTSSNSNIDTLPAGNHQVSQLKVRPFAKIVEKLQNENVQKLQKDEAMESTEPLTKRTKKVFDPVTYRQLCEQHHLELPGSKKSRAARPASEPKKTST